MADEEHEHEPEEKGEKGEHKPGQPPPKGKGKGIGGWVKAHPGISALIGILGIVVTVYLYEKSKNSSASTPAPASTQGTPPNPYTGSPGGGGGPGPDQILSITGPTGPAGAPGIPGVTGATGGTGATGATGPLGPAGPVGGGGGPHTGVPPAGNPWQYSSTPQVLSSPALGTPAGSVLAAANAQNASNLFQLQQTGSGTGPTTAAGANNAATATQQAAGAGNPWQYSSNPIVTSVQTQPQGPSAGDIAAAEALARSQWGYTGQTAGQTSSVLPGAVAKATQASNTPHYQGTPLGPGTPVITGH